MLFAFVVVVLKDITDLNKTAIGQIGGNHFNICFMLFLTKLICTNGCHAHAPALFVNCVLYPSLVESLQLLY